MWTWLASLLGGPVVNGLINAYKAKLTATNTQDRIAGDLAAKEIEAEIEARKQASAHHHRGARPMVHCDHPPAARVPDHHLFLEGDRVRQGPGPR